MADKNKPRTTLEMDGIFTQEDADNRFFVMKPCIDCGQYNKQDVREQNKPCVYCKGPMAIASNHWYSLRTFNTSKKLTLAERKKMGGASK